MEEVVDSLLGMSIDEQGFVDTMMLVVKENNAHSTESTVLLGR
jgi:hypothetical protein